MTKIQFFKIAEGLRSVRPIHQAAKQAHKQFEDDCKAVSLTLKPNDPQLRYQFMKICDPLYGID